MIKLILLVCLEGVKHLPHIPNIRSSKKRVKITAVKNLQNKIVKSGLKSSIKKFELAIHNKNIDNAEVLFVKAVSNIDKAACKGTIHKNAANRKKAQLAKHLQGISVAL